MDPNNARTISERLVSSSVNDNPPQASGTTAFGGGVRK